MGKPAAASAPGADEGPKTRKNTQAARSSPADDKADRDARSKRKKKKSDSGSR